MGHPSLCLNQKKIQLIQKKLLNHYGADAVRLFILSDSPPEKDIQWSEQGMISAYKFIQKLWTLNEKIKRKDKKQIIHQR